MKRVCFAVLVHAVILGTAFLSGSTPAWATGNPDVPVSPRLGISILLHKSAETAGAYECTVLVTDLATGSEIAAPSIIAKYGQAAEVVGSMPGGETLRAQVTVDARGAVAEYSVSLARGAEVLAQHKGKVSPSL